MNLLPLDYAKLAKITNSHYLPQSSIIFTVKKYKTLTKNSPCNSFFEYYYEFNFDCNQLLTALSYRRDYLKCVLNTDFYFAEF